jgi:SMC interacting uncharacterized protein involved in chromosome segregation
MKKLKEEAKMMKLKDKSKDNKIREQAQVIKGLKRKLSEKKVEISAKKSVVHNLTRKFYAERIQFNQERQQLDKEWEEERERNTKLTRKYRDLKRHNRVSCEFMDEVRQSLDAFAGVGVNEGTIPMNDLRWLNETGRMHLIKYEHRAQIGQWLHDAIRADESDAEDSAAEDSEDTEATTTVTIVAATRT